MDLLIFLALLSLNYQLYKMSQLAIIKDEQELDFGLPNPINHKGSIDYTDRVVNRLEEDGWVYKNGK